MRGRGQLVRGYQQNLICPQRWFVEIYHHSPHYENMPHKMQANSLLQITDTFWVYVIGIYLISWNFTLYNIIMQRLFDIWYNNIMLPSNSQQYTRYQDINVCLLTVYDEIPNQSSYRLNNTICGSIAFRIRSPSFSTCHHSNNMY